jgi:ribosomal protein S2
VYNSYCAVKEALALSIPSMGIVDSNTLTQTIILAIPGNDESGDCLVFYNDLVSNMILRKKFKAVILWFINVRRISRLKSFTKDKKQSSRTAFFSFLPKISLLIKRGMDFFFS